MRRVEKRWGVRGLVENRVKRAGWYEVMDRMMRRKRERMIIIIMTATIIISKTEIG